MRIKVLPGRGEVRMRLVVVLFFLITVTVPFAAQDEQKISKSSNPDFTGTWELDPKKSEFIRAVPVDKSADSTASKREPRKTDFGYATLVIEHRDPEMRIAQKVEYSPRTVSELTFYSDGRGENNKDGAKSITSSKTTWDGTRLVTTFFRKSDAGDESGAIISRTTWELSSDGKTLTILVIGGPDAGSEYPGFSKGMPVNKKIVYQRNQS